MPGDIYIFILL